MRKIFLAVVTASLLFSCSNGETKEKETSETSIAANSGWATGHLQGKVKILEESTYTADSTGVVGAMDSCCVEVKEFNNMGYVIKNSDRDSKGMLVEETILERTDAGKFISAVTTKNGKQVWSRTTSYDEDGKIAYAQDRDTTGEVHRIYTDVTENAIGQATSGKSLSGDSTYLGTWAFIYTDGMRTGNSWIDSSGVKLYDRVGALNDKGLLSKQTIMRVGKDGEVTNKTEIITYDSFDETNNWTQRTVTDEEGKVLKVEKRSYTYFE